MIKFCKILTIVIVLVGNLALHIKDPSYMEKMGVKATTSIEQAKSIVKKLNPLRP